MFIQKKKNKSNNPDIIILPKALLLLAEYKEKLNQNIFSFFFLNAVISIFSLKNSKIQKNTGKLKELTICTTHSISLSLCLNRSIQGEQEYVL